MEYDLRFLRERQVNRRIAPRTPVEDLCVDIVYEQPRSFGRRPRLHRLTVQVVDVSIEGALLVGPDRRELRAGAVVAVVAPGRAVAEIRHASADGGTGQFGVRFISMDAVFRSVLFEHLGRHREGLQTAWLHAR